MFKVAAAPKRPSPKDIQGPLHRRPRIGGRPWFLIVIGWGDCPAAGKGRMDRLRGRPSKAESWSAG